MGQTVICAPTPLLQAAQTGGAIEQLYEEIRYDWENLISITGVTEPDAMMAVLTQERVQQDVMQFIEDSYTQIPSINTEDLRSQLEEKVREYAYSHNIHATPESELEQNIKDLVDACIADYREAVSIPLLPTLLGKLTAIKPYFGKVFPIIGVGALIFLLFLFFLQKKKQNTLYYGCLSIATGGVVLYGATLLANHYDILNRLPFTDSAIKTLVVSYLQRILEALEQYGIVYFLVALIVLILYLLCCAICALIRTIKKPADTAQ